MHLFLPATIFSPGFENEQKLKPALCKKIEGPDEGMTPEQVAKRLIRGAQALPFPFCSLLSFAIERVS